MNASTPQAASVAGTQKRRLALQLAGLVTSQRELLLAELPAPSRHELERLINEVDPRFTDDADAFEACMEQADAGFNAAAAGYDESALVGALAGETTAVKQQVVEVMARGHGAAISAHTRGAIEAFLLSQSATLSKPSAAAIPPSPNGLYAPRRASKPARSWWRFWS